MNEGIQINEESLLRQLAKHLKVNYMQFADVWAHKFIWQRRLWNEVDVLGFNNRVCRDVANMILSEPVKISTANPNINRIISSELKGRLRFDSVLSKNLTHCMGIGDMLMVVYTDPLDRKPCIAYIPGYNIIPMAFNEHHCTELAWFTSTKMEDKILITVCIERQDRREIELFEYGNEHIMAINYGTPLWTRVMGAMKPVYHYQEGDMVTKFAWISTGLNNLRWIDTPFHNSFIWPIEIADTITEDWKLLKEEYKNSKKRIYASPSAIRRTYNVTDANGTPIPMKKVSPDDTLFELLDMSETPFKEWNPVVRFNEFIAKLKFDLEMFGTAVGLGHQMYNIDKLNVEVTATQVIMSNRDAMNTINNVKYNLKAGIKDIVFALIFEWFKMGLISPEDLMSVASGPDSIFVQFDDGVFVDKAKRIEEGLRLYQTVCHDGTRMITKYQFLTEYAGKSDEEARNIMQMTQQEFIEYLQFQMMMGGGGQQ